MKKISIIALTFVPFLASAQVAGPISFTLGQALALVQQLIPMMLALAVLLFMWGLVKFIANAGDPEARSGGIRHMVWGMIALFVMVGFWGIIGYVQQSLGLVGGEIVAPSAPTVSVLPGTQ